MVRQNPFLFIKLMMILIIVGKGSNQHSTLSSKSQAMEGGKYQEFWTNIPVPGSGRSLMPLLFLEMNLAMKKWTSWDLAHSNTHRQKVPFPAHLLFFFFPSQEIKKRKKEAAAAEETWLPLNSVFLLQIYPPPHQQKGIRKSWDSIFLEGGSLLLG